MLSLFKSRRVAGAHEKITQLVHMVSHAANLMSREHALNLIRRHGLVRDWNERPEHGRIDYSFAFNDPDVDDFRFCIEWLPKPESDTEAFAINFSGGINFAGFYGRASIPAQKYIVRAKDTARYRVTSKASSLAKLFIKNNEALDTTQF